MSWKLVLLFACAVLVLSALAVLFCKGWQNRKKRQLLVLVSQIECGWQVAISGPPTMRRVVAERLIAYLVLEKIAASNPAYFWLMPDLSLRPATFARNYDRDGLKVLAEIGEAYCSKCLGLVLLGYDAKSCAAVVTLLGLVRSATPEDVKRIVLDA